jgi:hypothetical protein
MQLELYDVEAERAWAANVRAMPLEGQMLEVVGERCLDFKPGCACCDMWEAWDLHAYGAAKNEIESTLRWWCCEEE